MGQKVKKNKMEICFGLLSAFLVNFIFCLQGKGEIDKILLHELSGFQHLDFFPPIEKLNFFNQIEIFPQTIFIFAQRAYSVGKLQPRPSRNITFSQIL